MLWQYSIIIIIIIIIITIIICMITGRSGIPLSW